MRRAIVLARRGYGATSPNPMVGSILVKKGVVIGQGWHRRAGEPHAEIEALNHARRKGKDPRGATLYVTLEPCCTYGRTPPCTDAIVRAGIRKVVIGAKDPNPKHSGKAYGILSRAGIVVSQGILQDECEELNAAFNHWIVHRTPLVTVKAAMSLDGKIATATGESKWITGVQARDYGMKLRLGADAILVGINTILADDPALTVRPRGKGQGRELPRAPGPKKLRRIVLDSHARTPMNVRVVADEHAASTTVVVTRAAPQNRVTRLSKRVRVLVAPAATTAKAGATTSGRSAIRLPWLLRQLGAEGVTSLLVEGGGEVNASFLLSRLAHRIAFFYAPKILGGANARKAVAGHGIARLTQALELEDLQWRRLGPDWLLEARVGRPALGKLRKS